MPKFTIIIPMYNVEEYIKQCIESCINQTFDSFEVIVVDDESKDDSLRYALEYEKKDKRVKVITQKNSGVSVARNNGIKNSNGEWILFVDGDDWLEKNALEKINNQLNEKIDVLITSYYVNKKEKETREHFFKNEKINFNPEDNIELVKNCICKTSISNENASTNVGVPWAKVYKAEFLKKNNCTFPKGLKRMQDMIFNLKVFYLANDVRCIDILTYHYRKNEGSATRKFSNDFDVTILEILRNIRNFIKEYNLENELKEYYDAKTIKLYLEMIRIEYATEGLKMSDKEKIQDLRKKLKELEIRSNINWKKQKLLNSKEKIMTILLKFNFVGLVYYLYKMKNLKEKY